MGEFQAQKGYKMAELRVKYEQNLVGIIQRFERKEDPVVGLEFRQIGCCVWVGVMGYIGKNLDVTYRYHDLLRMAISWTSDFVMSTCCKSLLVSYSYGLQKMHQKKEEENFLSFFFFWVVYCFWQEW